jgi:uncharacterized protein (TIGR00369 family)
MRPPGIGTLMGFGPELAEEGRVIFQGTPGRQHYNPIGTVHGGYSATLLDSCMACAVHTMLEAGQGYTTLELKVNYLRPMTEKTGLIHAEGKVISISKRVALAEGRIYDDQGKLYAHATTTCMILGEKTEAQAAE